MIEIILVYSFVSTVLLFLWVSDIDNGIESSPFPSNDQPWRIGHIVKLTALALLCIGSIPTLLIAAVIGLVFVGINKIGQIKLFGGKAR